MARERKFSSWFKNFNKGEFEKVNTMLKTQSMNIELTFILLHNNPYKDKLLPMLNELAKQLTGK
jgi:hypothetical protein